MYAEYAHEFVIPGINLDDTMVDIINDDYLFSFKYLSSILDSSF